MSKINKTINALKFYTKERQERIDRIQRKADPTESEKIFVGQETAMLKHTDELISLVEKKLETIVGKIPPTAIELERSVIGAVLLERNAMLEVAAYLRPEHFSDEMIQQIYTACTRLFNDARRIDMVTVLNEIRKMGVEESFNPNAGYVIAELGAGVSSAANIEYHARLLMEFAMRRKMIEVSGSFLTDAYDDTKDVFILLDEWEKNLNIIKSWIKK